MPRLLVLLSLLASPGLASAGLHLSEETLADLPSRWAGFLLDQRALRRAASAALPASALRTRYAREAARLAGLKRELTADEAADLGGLRVRLGEPAKAVEVLRPASRRHPAHFRIAANLGTAWQMAGNLTQAAAALEQAVRLAPGKSLRAEKLHLRLVRGRMKEKPGTQSLDDLFGAGDPPDPKKLPAAAAALAQQLALWLPADGRLLWQLGELAGAQGDPATRAAILDGCVTEFGLRDPKLLARRKAARAALAGRGTKKDHEGHASLFKPRSSRPLLTKGALEKLPAIAARGVNALPWDVLAETSVDSKARPTFHRYLKELAGKKVALDGYQQPIGEGTDLGAFLLVENPVGCWYCEMPEMTALVLVELPEGKAGTRTRARLRITGTLALNAADPENFLYILRDARIEKAAE